MKVWKIHTVEFYSTVTKSEIFRKMDRSGNDSVKLGDPDSERQIYGLIFSSHKQTLALNVYMGE